MSAINPFGKPEKTAPFSILCLTLGFVASIEGVFARGNALSVGRSGIATRMAIRAHFFLECKDEELSAKSIHSIMLGRSTRNVIKTPLGLATAFVVKGNAMPLLDECGSGDRALLEQWMAASEKRVLAQAQSLGLSPAGALCRATHDLDGGELSLPGSASITGLDWSKRFASEVCARREARQIQEETQRSPLAANEREGLTLTEEARATNATPKRPPRAL